MKPIEIIASDLFEKVRSRFSNLQMGDESGMVTADPTAARFFDFDFTVEGNNLGRVSISINQLGNLKVFYSQGIMENADSITQTIWYDFLKEMRFFAKRRLLRFDTRDITKNNLEKEDFQFLAQTAPKDTDMNESAMFGSSKTSHRKLEDTDLIIRHTEAIDPTKPGARSRKIKNLFIQNKEGERFKFPFVYLPGARAMQRHVANGGYPHDKLGQHIVNTCEEILKLSDFGRKVKHATLNDNAHGIIERAGQKLKSLRMHLEGMCKQGYYESYAENYAPQDDIIELDDATMESYKDTFTINKFDETLADVFPILHKIMQEAGEIDLEAIVSEDAEQEEADAYEAMKHEEIDQFESWAEELTNESFSDEELQALEQLVQERLPVGANDEAVQALAGIGIKDPALVKALRAQAAMPNGAEADARETIKTFMGADAAKINWGDMDAGAQQPQAQAPVQPVAEDDGDRKLFRDLLAKWTEETGKKIAAGEYDDWTEVASDLEAHMHDNFSEISQDTAERIAKRMFSHDTLAQYRVKPTQAMDKDIPKDGEEDDDASFLSKLRQQARSGSIKPGADTGGIDETDGEEGSNRMKEVAEVISGFFNREDGTWTKGEHGVVTHVKRHFSDEEGNGGDREAELAAQLIKHLNAKHGGKDELGDVKKLAGMGEGPNKSDIPAYQRKASGDKDWKMSTKDLEDEKTKSPTSSAGLARRKAELGMSETQDILKLAGLAK